MKKTPQHVYQVLTKRHNRMAKFFEKYDPPENACIGVTVENRKNGLPRIDKLRTVNAKVHFLSVRSLNAWESMGPSLES